MHTLAYAIPDDEIVPLLIVAVLLLLGIRGLAWNYLKRLRARSWMTNHGRIELVSVEVRDVRHFRYYIARLDYSYSVNGEYYSGYREILFFREKSADKFTAAMKNQMVLVRANPQKPDRSALLADDQPGGWPA